MISSYQKLHMSYFPSQVSFNEWIFKSVTIWSDGSITRKGQEHQSNTKICSALPGQIIKDWCFSLNKKKGAGTIWRKFRDNNSLKANLKKKIMFNWPICIHSAWFRKQLQTIYFTASWLFLLQIKSLINFFFF